MRIEMIELWNYNCRLATASMVEIVDTTNTFRIKERTKVYLENCLKIRVPNMNIYTFSKQPLKWKLRRNEEDNDDV
jgi:hypothetical protein